MARILVVDDEPSILQVLKMNLDLEGYTTSLAGDGETALKRIEMEHPDLVVLDIMMPVLDGWEVLRRIREMPLARQPRVVVLTARAGDQHVEKGLDLGADQYLTKPFDIDELLRVVSETLEVPNPRGAD